MRIKDDAKGAGGSVSYFCDAHLREKSRAARTPKREAPAKIAPTPKPRQTESDAKSLRVQNAGASTASLLTTVKAKGAKITRDGSIHESAVRCQMLERDASAEKVSAKTQNRFGAILIQEGLGNFGDGYYYTKEALKSAVVAFEGRKFMADHPSKFEDEVRPERSVRDVYGHYENLKYVEAKDGTGQLHGDLVVLAGSDSEWLRSRLIHALDYAKKYPDKDFLGLSINASGDATPMSAIDFLESGLVVPSARQKLEQAIAEGLSEIRLVKLIDSAVSCDLVTEAGAKGKVLQLLEANKMAKQKEPVVKKEEKDAVKKEGEEKAVEANAVKSKEGDETKESEEKAVEAEPAVEAAEPAAEAAPAADADKKADAEGEDVAADRALLQDELKKHGLIKDDGAAGAAKDAPAADAPKADAASDGADKEESVEEAKGADEEKEPELKDVSAKEGEEKPMESGGVQEANEAMLQSAIHYHRAFKQAGYDSKEAASRAVEAMKCAKMAHESMESSKQEAGAVTEAKEAKVEAKVEAKKEAAAPVIKESDAMIILRGKNADLEERLAKLETEQYVDKKLKESRLPMSVTKKFKESVKAFKNAKEVDEKFKLFMEGYKATSGEADSLDAFVMVEKNTTGAEAGVSSLDDCVEE